MIAMMMKFNRIASAPDRMMFCSGPDPRVVCSAYTVPYTVHLPFPITYTEEVEVYTIRI